MRDELVKLGRRIERGHAVQAATNLVLTGSIILARPAEPVWIFVGIVFGVAALVQIDLLWASYKANRAMGRAPAQQVE